MLRGMENRSVTSPEVESLRTCEMKLQLFVVSFLSAYNIVCFLGNLPLFAKLLFKSLPLSSFTSKELLNQFFIASISCPSEREQENGEHAGLWRERRVPSMKSNQLNSQMELEPFQRLHWSRSCSSA